MKKIIFIIFSLHFVIVSFSQEIKISSEKTNINGKKYYLHTVEENQTLYSIAKAYKITVEEIKKSNSKLTESIKKGQSILIPYKEIEYYDTLDYTIKSGDTKYSLAKKYNITIDEFNILNPKLAKNDDLKVGSLIKLPDFTNNIKTNSNSNYSDTSKFYYHIVNKGETISSLSRKYKVSRDDIFKNNKIENNTIKIGEIIIIPKNDFILNSNHKNTISQNNLAACDSINWYTNKEKIVISILLPFDKTPNWRKFNESSNKKQLQKIGNLSENICAFYYGILTALDNFSKYDNKIIINTYDIGKDNNIIEKLFNENKLSENTFIIGPAYTSQIEFLNEKLTNNNNNIQLILPFVNNVEILRKYPNNIVIHPSDFQIKLSIAKYLSKKDSINIIIVNDSDQESLKDADQMNRILTRDSLKKYNISVIKSSNFNELKNYLKKNSNNYVINYLNSETSINELLTKLYSFLDYNITLIGEKNILDYDNIDLLYFQKVKYTYYSHNNIDYSNNDVKTFVEKYRSNFFNEPNDYSFNGYDIMNYFLDIRLKYSDKCFQCIQNPFIFKGLSGEQQYNNTNRYFDNSYSNRSVFLYELQEDFNFKLVYSNSENK